jgi:excisionase family DNA binding protein
MAGATVRSGERLALGRDEAAEATGLSVMTIDRAIAAGDLASHKVRGRRLILVEDLLNWVRADDKEAAA